MNEVIQNHLFTIILFLLFIILLLMGVIVYILFKLLTDKNISKTPSSQVTSVPIMENIKSTYPQKPEKVSEKFYCTNHQDKNSMSSCLICEDVFCEDCLIEHEGMYFCREHFKIFANNQWEQITDQKTTPDQPEDGLYIWDFKRALWKEQKIASFVLTHYKINVENDYIESYVQLNVVKEKAEDLKSDLKKYKAKH